MSAVDLAAVIVAVVCLATVAVLTVAIVSLVRSLRELHGVVDELRASALPMVDDLRATVAHADAELSRVDGVIGRAERVAVTVDHASRLTHKAFAPPLIKGLSLVSGAGHAGRRLRERRRARRSLDVAATSTLTPAPGDAASVLVGAPESARTLPSAGTPRQRPATATGSARRRRRR